MSLVEQAEKSLNFRNKQSFSARLLTLKSDWSRQLLAFK